MNITPENLDKFKQRMRIYHSHSDEALRSYLESSYLFLKNKCGDFSLEGDNQGTELMYERARYAYHDNLEYFDEHFMSMVISFSLTNLPLKEDEDVENSIQTIRDNFW